jgi:hypothetical protein
MKFQSLKYRLINRNTCYTLTFNQLENSIEHEIIDLLQNIGLICYGFSVTYKEYWGKKQFKKETLMFQCKQVESFYENSISLRITGDNNILLHNLISDIKFLYINKKCLFKGVKYIDNEIII